ncbi:rho GTPase-activating protein 26 isoform X2 [Coccinella septempunctata]|uniref:rho GTPase-activating protein 26 isoform X2 n=1 Tax=Coccinella septempunctata TaxID=41139 RepID=UPI001D097803|nr:rho GTPase-activating protein 26 isoform X2 [Coccinella septempunctata]
MGVTLPPLEFTECISDSPYFRENLRKHECELEVTNQQIKRIIKEVKDLLQAAKQLGMAQRSFANCLNGFTFQSIGETQTDEERIISKSLHEFGSLINMVEDERDNMLANAYSNVVKPLEDFRKTHIGNVKNEKKKFEKQTAKFCKGQEMYLNLTTKKTTHSLQEADASVNMAESYFRAASMEYIYLIQEFHERKKFEFVETLLSFLFGWLTFYHQGHEVANDFRPFMVDLQTKIQKTRTNFNDYKDKLKTRMAEVKKQCLEEPIRNAKGCKKGYLYLLEKKAFGTTWIKYYCTYNKETKEFTMLQYNQLTSKSICQPETMVLTQCVRRMSDSIDKRFCFDIQCDAKPGVVLTFQALSEQDRTCWLDIMDGKEPTYVTPSVNKIAQINAEERTLDEVGIQFLKRCIEVLENRGLEEQGLYRVVGVTSKVNKLLTMGLDRRKADKLSGLDDPQEWESKTITSALKNYLRNLPEPIMTYRYHNGFIAAAKNKDVGMRVNDIHTLIYRLPKLNMEVLRILLKHLTNVAAKSEKNLMTTSNLGVCFGPTLLRPEEETVASITDLKFYNVVVEVLIENYDRIFNTEPERFNSENRQGTKSPNNSTSSISHNNVQNRGSPSELMPSTYIGPDGTEVLHASNPRNFSPNDHLNNSHYARKQYKWKPSYTCTVKTYYEPPPIGNTSSSLYNVHESPNNGIPNHIPRNDHVVSNNHTASNDRLHRYKNMVVSSVSSQSESNIPNLPSYSPTNLRSYSRLGPNSSSSSNESISSISKEGNGYNIAHKKIERSSYNVYPKSARTPGNVRVRTLYTCLAGHDGELSFEPNQIITNVRASQEPGWLEGTLNGKTGLIPENYVEFLP